MLKVLLISSPKEKARVANILALEQQLPNIIHIPACFPEWEHVPFIDRISTVTQQRTGTPLTKGEIGCLLSHRRAWRYIQHISSNDDEHFLIIESDSILNAEMKYFSAIDTKKFDIFFWGGWEGHIQLFRSSQNRIDSKYMHGEPYIRSIYCTYGYSINKKAAKILLEQTKKVTYPVDQFKRFLQQKTLRLGAIKPEIISSDNTNSSIRTNNLNSKRRLLFVYLLDLKNKFICFWK